MRNKSSKFLAGIVVIMLLSSCGDPCKKGHQWVDATCTKQKYCSVCEITEGDALGHTYGEPKIVSEASCTMPGKKEIVCSECGNAKSEEIPMIVHTYGEPKVISEASCSKPGEKEFACSECGATKKEEIPTTAHTVGEWEIVVQATATTKGKKAQKCSVCGVTLAEEEFEKSPDEIKNDYISNCANYTYKEISRNPDNYKGKFAHFRGEIIQSIESGDTYTFRVNITKTSYGWTDTILVSYSKKDVSESRLLEDDVVDLYGMLAGTHTYETVMGNNMTVPLLYAEYVILR